MHIPYGAAAESIVRSNATGFYPNCPGSPPMHIHTDEVFSCSFPSFLSMIQDSCKHVSASVTSRKINVFMTLVVLACNSYVYSKDELFQRCL